MSLATDHKYVNLLSVHLERFQRKSSRLYNCRCPICKDSKKKKSKARGFFYIKGNRINYMCHNCGLSVSLGSLIETLDSELYKKYIYERFTSGENGFSNYKKPNEAEEYNKVVQEIKQYYPEELKKCKTISSLEENHYVRSYIESRLIPKEFWNKLYFTEDFKALVDSILPGKYDSLMENDKRIIIPFLTKDKKLLAIQGRSIVPNSSLRYITIKIIENESKIYGMDRVNLEKDFYITEGPIDSMFIDNCIAAGGADISFEHIPKNGIFIFDNERKNKEIVKRMTNVIDAGYRIVIWPPNIFEKDINDIIKSGMSKSELMDLIQKRTYNGAKAKLMLIKWRDSLR